MKITIVGAILVIAAVLAGGLLLYALNKNDSELSNQQYEG